MPRTLENVVRARTLHTAATDLRTQRADMLIVMRELDRADLRAAHMRLAAAITALDDTIATLEELR